MKKQRIAEAVYFVVALLFVGICIGNGKESEPKAFEEITSAPIRDTIPTPVLSEADREGNPTGTVTEESEEPADSVVPEQTVTDELKQPLDDPGRMPGATEITSFSLSTDASCRAGC